MTQDAMPADDRLIENMVRAFDGNNIAAVYARQLPNEDASLGERFSRQFNYPEESCTKSASDKDRLGIKTYFCSNACAMYNREIFERLGKFPKDMIFNEDMVFAHTLIENGYSIAYAADAAVYHSHNYTNMQQFRRNLTLRCLRPCIRRYLRMYLPSRRENHMRSLRTNTSRITASPLCLFLLRQPVPSGLRAISWERITKSFQEDRYLSVRQALHFFTNIGVKI
jgi:GT2 family glycosyltransferase